MPQYTYKCNECGKVFDSCSTISERDEPRPCECGSPASRSLVDEFKGGSSIDCTMKENERWSWSMGVHVNQIPEMQRRYPGSEYHPVTGQLKVSSRQDKIRKMKERGLTEFN